ncbi:MAG: hypothetical protein L3J93_05555, partial [Thermoplasmata archaeon]|nr:hypothetical protein [Thermoplasmata archaeon]
MRKRHAPEGPEWVARPSGFELPVLLAELPKEVPFGFLGRILPTTEDLALRMQIHRIERSRSLALVEGAGAVAQAELSEGRPGEGVRTAELELEAGSAQELAARLAAGEQDLFKVGLTLRVRAPTRSRAERMRAELLGRLRTFGFRPRVPVYETAEVLAP